MARTRTTVKTTVVIYQEKARLFLVSNEARDWVEGIAEQGAAAAQEINPERSGRSSSQIKALGSEIRDGTLVAYYGSTSPIWHILEFGSVKNPPFRALTQAAQRLGLKYEPM